MKFFQLLFCLFFVDSLGYCEMDDSDNSYRETLSLIHEYSKYVKKEKGLRNTSYGLSYFTPDGVYDGKIHTIAAGYSTDQGMKYEEARTYFYRVIDGLIDHINAHKEIGKYFFHYPVDYRDFEFHFSFDYEGKGFLKPEEIHSIHISQDEILYLVVEKSGPTEIIKKPVSSDIYLLEGFMPKHRSIRRNISEDLALHKK
jgi:hypothetical protein